MDSGIYQKWIEDIDALSEAQREEDQKILSGRSSEAEVIAAVEGRLLADRVCPLCQRQGAVRTSAARCDVAVSTAFRWRHRFLRAITTDTAPLGGIVEADETYVLESHKGSRAWKNAAAGQLRCQGAGAQAPQARRQSHQARPVP